MFIFLVTSILFSKVTKPIYIPTNSAEIFSFLHIRTSVVIFCLLGNSHSNRYDVITHCDFPDEHLFTLVEHLFTPIFPQCHFFVPVWMSSFEKWLFCSSVHFHLDCSFLLLVLNYMISLYILYTNPFQYIFCKYFLPLNRFIHFFYYFFNCAECFSFIQSDYLNFAFIACVILKKKKINDKTNIIEHFPYFFSLFVCLIHFLSFFLIFIFLSVGG